MVGWFWDDELPVAWGKPLQLYIFLDVLVNKINLAWTENRIFAKTEIYDTKESIIVSWSLMLSRKFMIFVCLLIEACFTIPLYMKLFGLRYNYIVQKKKQENDQKIVFICTWFHKSYKVQGGPPYSLVVLLYKTLGVVNWIQTKPIGLFSQSNSY